MERAAMTRKRAVRLGKLKTDLLEVLCQLSDAGDEQVWLHTSKLEALQYWQMHAANQLVAMIYGAVRCVLPRQVERNMC